MNVGSLPDFSRESSRKLDAWLWRHGFHNAQVRYVTRAQIMGAVIFLATGVALALFSTWIFWFGVGFALHGANFFFLARQILGMNLSAYRNAMLVVLLSSSGLRLALTALMLYVALVACSAPAGAIAGGLIAAVLTALGSYALAHFRGGE